MTGYGAVPRWAFVAASVAVGSLLLAGQAALAYEVVKVDDGGTITGTVKLSGSVPPPQKLEVTRDPRVCGAEAKTADTLVASSSGGLKNVVVSLNGIEKGKAFSDAPIELDQRKCWFTPHVVLVRAGRSFTLLNSDKVLHNFRTPATKANRALNKAQPKFKRRLPITIKNPDVIPVNCDIHEWMHAVIVVMGHPYHALTDDNGAFTLPDVPPGRYTLTFWHEVLGRQSREVTVRAGGETKVAAEFRGR
ncbi:MAG: carboxypeptidase regulatory-like domain-containing protein [Candidatus Methylomirabilia bacterium]